MAEKLLIKNFGPINLIDLDIKKITIVIGENATGKSTVAKLLAICRYFSYVVKTEYTIYDMAVNDDDGAHFFNGLASRGLIEYIKEDSYIKYENEDYSFEVRFVFPEKSVLKEDEQFGFYKYQSIQTYIKLNTKSIVFSELLNELGKIMPEDKAERVAWTIPTSFFQNDVASVLENSLFIPIERTLQSLFSLGKGSMRNIGDSLFNDLANLDAISKNFSGVIPIEPLNISYTNENGRSLIKKNHELEFYSLLNGASGYKSALPIILSIKYYNEIRKKRKIILIEEAEMNLHPSTQRELINFLVQSIVNYNNQIFITTHSPYILTSLNNLIYAYQLGKQNAQEANKIISKNYWINPNDVSCYLLLSNGTCEEIFDREESLIKAELIDEVSSKINKEFNELINIELGISDEKN